MTTSVKVVGFPCLDNIVQKYYILTAIIRLAILNKSFAFIKLSLHHIPLAQEQWLCSAHYFYHFECLSNRATNARTAIAKRTCLIGVKYEQNEHSWFRVSYQENIQR